MNTIVNTNTIIDADTDSFSWAYCRTMFIQAMDKITAPDFDGWDEEPKPDPGAAQEDVFNWMLFNVFSEGFITGAETFTPTYRLDQLASAGAGLARQGKDGMQAALDLLKQYGVEKVNLNSRNITYHTTKTLEKPRIM